MVAAVLLAVHAGLALWGLAGVVELLVDEPPWPRLSNPLFELPVLVAQWALVLLAASVFIAGYLARWPRLPAAMAAVYAAMAALCAFETFTILRHPDRFLDMALEYATYVAIIVFLSRAPAMRRRFVAGDPHSSSLSERRR